MAPSRSYPSLLFVLCSLCVAAHEGTTKRVDLVGNHSFGAFLWHYQDFLDTDEATEVLDELQMSLPFNWTYYQMNETKVNRSASAISQNDTSPKTSPHT